MAHYAPDPSRFARVTPVVGTYYLAALRQLRAPGPHALSLRFLPGLVTFPSFHAAMGVIGVYCCRGKTPVFLASLALNAFMIASTPLFGSHYLVDLAAGAALAALVLLLPPSLSRFCRIGS
jgi:membrane-associated phospholipid phosphatase